MFFILCHLRGLKSEQVKALLLLVKVILLTRFCLGYISKKYKLFKAAVKMITFWWMTINTNIVFFRIICADGLHIIQPGTFIRRVIRVHLFQVYFCTPGGNYNKRREIVNTWLPWPTLNLNSWLFTDAGNLDTKKARHRLSSVLKEDTLCSCWTQNEMETQLHFWTSRTTHKSATYSILLMQTTIKSIYCAFMCNVY